jgi:hypothetical protein
MTIERNVEIKAHRESIPGPGCGALPR